VRYKNFKRLLFVILRCNMSISRLTVGNISHDIHDNLTRFVREELPYVALLIKHVLSHTFISEGRLVRPRSTQV
jgi:hypothetical protein